MALQTITLNDYDDLLPKSTPRKPKEGIFAGCLGTLDAISYQGETIDIADIEILLLNEYRFRELGLESFDYFRNRFVNIWNRNFFTFKENLINNQQFDVGEYTITRDHVKDLTETGTRKANNKTDTTSKSEGTGSGDNKFSNTPNQYLANPESYNGLTTITKDTNTSSANSSSGVTSDTTDNTTRNDNETLKYNENRIGNGFEKWLSLSLQNRNIIYDFIDKFQPIFINTIVIKDFNGYSNNVFGEPSQWFVNYIWNRRR